VYRADAGDLSTVVDGEEGDDRIDARGSEYYAGLYGDEGDDVVIGGESDDELGGGPGEDTLTGGAGDDALNGDGYLGAAAGRDAIDGGPGRDTVGYGEHKTPVTVDLRRAGPQGEPAEGDTISSIENIHGGRAADRLVGDEHANVIRGGGANDSISALAGDDVLWAADPHRPPASGTRLGCGAGSDLVRSTLSHTVVPAACEHARAGGFSIRTAFRRVGDAELRVPVTQRPHYRRKPYCRGTVELSGPYPPGSTE
jgi:Ca2+-binding RTX toxin-like protein